VSGGAGGSILSMIISLKNNRMLLSKRKSFKEIRKSYEDHLTHRQLKFKEADPAMLKELRLEIIKSGEKDALKLWIILALVLIVTSTLLIFLFFYVDTADVNKDAFSMDQYISNREKKKRTNFNLFIYYGSYRYNAREYLAAAKEYKQALRIFPEGFKAQLGFANTYAALCIERDTLCELAKGYLNQSIKEFDTSKLFLKHVQHY